jgi:pectate lyase
LQKNDTQKIRLLKRRIFVVTLHFSSSSEGLQIKGKSAYTEMNITIEGVGNDATINGFGFLLRNCKNVEIRNIAIMNFMDDGISIDTDNCNLWLHNIDFFYGKAGGGSSVFSEANY